MNDRKEFSDVRRGLRPGDVFSDPSHDWKKKTDSVWVGSCPWHDSESGTCFKVYEPANLKWKCHSCGRGGGPLDYVAELESVGTGTRGDLTGEAFFRAWEALADHSGCEGPPEMSDGDDTEKRPLQNRKRKPSPQPPERPPDTSSTPDTSRKGERSERELRRALVRYREALKTSDQVRAYVEGRGLSVETLRAYGCGYAAPGEWLDDDLTNDSGNYNHRAPNGRIVTPHTTPDGRLVCLSGRGVEPCPEWLKKRHLAGHTPELFNAAAIEEGSGPLVLCEGPFDALSFIEAGHARTVALHNTDGVPWGALRGNASQLVFAFDADDTGEADAIERARGAVRRGYKAHILPDGEGTYSGHSDPNEALQNGGLSLQYVQEISGQTDGGAGQARSDEEASENDVGRESTPADLVAYWNGADVGHLGRWLWERGGVPDGDVGPRLYADRELHEWIEEALEAGPDGTSDAERARLEWALWRIYATHGPEEVSEDQIPDPPAGAIAGPLAWDLAKTIAPGQRVELPNGQTATVKQIRDHTDPATVVVDPKSGPPARYRPENLKDPDRGAL